MGELIMERMLVLVAIALMPGTALAQGQVTPLFATDAPIQIRIQGPVNGIARKAAKDVTPQAATLTLASPSETHAIQLSARGLSRRTAGICDFPPLRVQFTQAPAATSLFAGQRRLKLVTHCKGSAGFQQHLLTEYSAYLLYNQLTPLSYKARLATVEYAEPDGKVTTTRWGFFIEDTDDVGKRNGSKEARLGDRILATQLEPAQSARVALFQYMIGNLDWSMRAGPQGEGCCHNNRLFSTAGSAPKPAPYDFDFSGLVDAPYALPPEGIPVRNVRQRIYRGYCIHNVQAPAAAADMRAKRGAIEGVFSQVPGMDEKTRRKALNFLAGFFSDIATDESLRTKVLKNCIG